MPLPWSMRTRVIPTSIASSMKYCTAVENFKSSSVDCSNAEEIIRYFGGFEMVAAIGAMLRAAECHLIIMVDGFIMTACALAASRLYPDIIDYMVFGHSGDEGGHARMLGLLNAKPLLSLAFSSFFTDSLPSRRMLRIATLASSAFLPTVFTSS